MKIESVQIRNFRKLKNCHIDFDDKETVFVGANNSGKTSAISAIVWFLKKRPILHRNMYAVSPRRTIAGTRSVRKILLSKEIPANQAIFAQKIAYMQPILSP